MNDLTYGDLERARQLSLAQAQGLAEVIGPMLEAHKPAESPEAESKRCALSTSARLQAKRSAWPTPSWKNWSAPMPAEILTQAQAKALHAGPWPEGVDVRTELALEALASGEVVAVSAEEIKRLRAALAEAPEPISSIDYWQRRGYVKCRECFDTGVRSYRQANHLGGAYVDAPCYCTAPPAPAVPEGWQLVPVEPTRGMCAAAVVFANGNAVYKNVASEVLRIEEGIYGEAYKAMLAAAPKPEAGT